MEVTASTPVATTSAVTSLFHKFARSEAGGTSDPAIPNAKPMARAATSIVLSLRARGFLFINGRFDGESL
jgi:hypothetical protein